MNLQFDKNDIKKHMRERNETANARFRLAMIWLFNDKTMFKDGQRGKV